MIRVVLDTNIIVSALLQPLGPSAQVFLLAIGGSIQLCISGNVYAEYEEVIRRPRLRRDESVIAATLQTIRERSVWVKPLELFVHAPIRMTISFLNVRRRLARPIWYQVIARTFLLHGSPPRLSRRAAL